MANLIIPTKTLQDNFKLEDFKNDFTELERDIQDNKASTDEEIKSINDTVTANKTTADKNNTDMSARVKSLEDVKNVGSKSDNWWIEDKATGLIRQGGSVTINFSNSDYGSADVTFHKAFPTKVCSIIGVERSNTITTGGMFNIACLNATKTKFTARAIVLNLTNRTGSVTAYWEATGY